jgi:hypothetical protein
VIVGNKEKFAIEVEVLYDSLDQWLSCRFFFLFNKNIICDSEREMYVNDILILMYGTYRDQNNREHQTLFNLSTIELYERLDKTFFGPVDTGYERTANDEVWARFIVNPIEWHIYIIESDVNGRILFNNPTVEEVSDVLLDKGYFDKVYSEMYKYLDDLFSRIKGDGATC